MGRRNNCSQEEGWSRTWVTRIGNEVRVRRVFPGQFLMSKNPGTNSTYVDLAGMLILLPPFFKVPASWKKAQRKLFADILARLKESLSQFPPVPASWKKAQRKLFAEFWQDWKSHHISSGSRQLKKSATKTFCRHFGKTERSLTHFLQFPPAEKKRNENFLPTFWHALLQRFLSQLHVLLVKDRDESRPEIVIGNISI